MSSSDVLIGDSVSILVNRYCFLNTDNHSDMNNGDINTTTISANNELHVYI